MSSPAAAGPRRPNGRSRSLARARFGTLRLTVMTPVIRSDNGLVYQSRQFWEACRGYRLQQEFITPYTPEQNGTIGRFFQSLKEECVWQHMFPSFAAARREIAGWIRWYNEERPHQALGYRSTREHRSQRGTGWLDFGEHCTRYQERIGNVTPADVYGGRGEAIQRPRARQKSRSSASVTIAPRACRAPGANFSANSRFRTTSRSLPTGGADRQLLHSGPCPTRRRQLKPGHLDGLVEPLESPGAKPHGNHPARVPAAKQREQVVNCFRKWTQPQAVRRVIRGDTECRLLARGEAQRQKDGVLAEYSPNRAQARRPFDQRVRQ
jgi:hypothetical protein